MKYKPFWLLSGIAGFIYCTLIGCGTENHTTSVKNMHTHSSVSHPNASHATKSKTDSFPTTTPSKSVQTPQVPHFTSINMVNDQIGWATGRNTVWYTKDGGLSWKAVTPPGFQSAPFLQMSMNAIGNQMAWIAASNGKSIASPLSIYYTANAGQSWVKQKIQATGYPMSLHFLDPDQGWIALFHGAAAGSEGETIYHTYNGGMTWHTIAQTNQVKGGNLPFVGDKTGVSFVNAKVGWVTGFTALSGHIYFYRTTDGGYHWSLQILHVPNTFQNEQFTSFPPIFFGQQKGILPVSYGMGLLVYRTNDGGNTWTSEQAVQSTVPNQTIQAWSFPNMKDGFVIDGKQILTTSDGGQTWNSFTPNMTLKNVMDMQFVSSTHGWIVMNTGTLFYTTDGGHFWNQVK
ncbi:hypothetical protein FY534_01840 [Alicyclobacillus sp. TC]|uniref:VPS10 domain-containing protein n=1 Tax=Alicyclobacillus sp. TC TaxID=2606450 RepID=UPI0019344CF4|nr:hypothetical protein [Alicyclobacillus sp. TC]QRF22562.1 hypothetical protein FY534_01840 [Alicyclobacillus sp. TC]